MHNLRAAKEESTILDPRPMESMTVIKVFTDASGGDASKIKNRIGGFAPKKQWVYMPWPEIIRDNRMNSLGIKFAHKPCTLEGFAALATISAMLDRVRNREVIIFCDNAGLVEVYRKKHSRCPCAYTIAKAM